MTVAFTKLVQSEVVKNGWKLSLPGKVISSLVNFGEPDIYAESTVQLYPLGAKLEFSDGRLFRYAKFGGTSTNPPMARMVFNNNICPGGSSGCGYEGTCNATAVDAEIVDIDETDNEAENWYEDGMLAVYPAIAYHCYRIAGNEAYDAIAASHIRLYLDGKVSEALVVASTGISAYRSIFSNAVAGAATTNGTTFSPAVGVPLCQTMTSGSFGWIQRKGLAIITPTAYFGDTAGERLCMVHAGGDGTICTAASADPSTGYQIVGYLAAQTNSGYGDLLVQLMFE